MQAIITYPEKKEEIKALKAFLKALKIKFEYKETVSDAFAQKIDDSKKQAENGEYITIKDSKNIWKSILSE